MADRQAAIDRFLDAAGWGRAERSLLAADASFRAYHRVTLGRASAVLMDAPPPGEDVRPFERIAKLLANEGFSAPRVLEVEPEQGLMLLEDLGDQTYTRALAAGADEPDLYRRATDLLIELHRRIGPDSGLLVELPPYDEGRLLEEAALLVDWTLPALRGGSVDARLRAGYLAAWRAVLPKALAVPATLVLRDYHVDNLMVLDGRHGRAACGLLDFQDAVAGPVSYDLVSLLEDARRDIDNGLAEAMRARYLAAFPALDPEAFAASYAILGAQRGAKIIGIFTRLCWRDGKPQYLDHIPRVWGLLSRALLHPALAPVRQWFDREIADREKCRPPERNAP